LSHFRKDLQTGKPPGAIADSSAIRRLFSQNRGKKLRRADCPIKTAGCARTCAGREDHVCEGWISVENDFLHCLVFAWLIGESSPHLTMNHYVQVLTVLLHIFSLV